MWSAFSSVEFMLLSDKGAKSTTFLPNTYTQNILLCASTLVDKLTNENRRYNLKMLSGV